MSPSPPYSSAAFPPNVSAPPSGNQHVPAQEQRLRIAASDGGASRHTLPVRVEDLHVALVDTLARLPFSDAIVTLDAALRGGPDRTAVQRAHVGSLAQHVLPSSRMHHRFRRLLDFVWDEAGVVGEFDGWQKYPCQRAGFDEVRKQEKLREDAIRSSGMKVIRFSWEDLMEPGCRRLCELLTRHGVHRVG